MLERGTLILLLAFGLSACSGVEEKVREVINKPLEYKQSTDAEPLEIPPDLTRSSLRDTMSIPGSGASGSATFSAFSAQDKVKRSSRGSKVLPKNKSARMARDGDRRWLVLSGSVDDVWDNVREFWIENGFLLVLEDPEIGIMETEWAENRAEVPLDRLQGFIGSILDNVYDAGSRDKFRVRLEQGEQGNTTEVYLTHQRVEEEIHDDSVKWRYRPRDPETEVEMLSRLMVHMGVSTELAAQRVAATVTPNKRVKVNMIKGEGGAVLVMGDGFSRAWRIVGQALDQVGFTVEDRDRSRGIYYVRYRDPEGEQEEDGWLSKLAIWRSSEPPPVQQFQIIVRAADGGTRVSVLNEQGKPETTGTGGRILSLVHEQIR